MRKRVLLSAAACLLCAACGFEPMYGSGFAGSAGQEHSDVQQRLALIDISNIPDKEGQFLRNALIDRFYDSGRPADPRYTLNVSKISESSYDLDITVSSDSTRAQLTLSVGISLVDNESKEAVLNRNLRASASYNIMKSEFATRVSAQNTREDALNDLARQIELQTVLYFDRVGESF
jgi:LPS-assembly lipoprotein